MMDELKPFASVLLPIAFVAWFLFGVRIMSLFGWRTLAKEFRARGKPHGERLAWQSMRIGRTNYNRALHFVLANEGLYLATPLLLRLGHPPLLIPWSELRIGSTQKILWMEITDIDVGRQPLIRLKVKKKIADRFVPFLHKRQNFG